MATPPAPHWLASVPVSPSPRFIGVQNVHPGAEVSIRQDNVIVNVIEKSKLIWRCDTCGVSNPEARKLCRRNLSGCCGRRPGKASANWTTERELQKKSSNQPQPQFDPSGRFIPSWAVGGWICSCCRALNPPDLNLCWREGCSGLKPGFQLPLSEDCIPRECFRPTCTTCHGWLMMPHEPIRPGVTYVLRCAGRCLATVEWTAGLPISTGGLCSGNKPHPPAPHSLPGGVLCTEHGDLACVVCSQCRENAYQEQNAKQFHDY